jgi:hypothetical protein
MGITIAYRGRLADLARVEDFEDRLLDFALEVGGLARIWRSADDDAPGRMVRGVLLDLTPGQETTSLLISPEGWLLGLMEIKEAERGLLTEPPWCFVKTQFGPLEGHVVLVELFAALKREFLPDLEVRDEGGYWETRDLAELTRKRAFLDEAMDRFAEGLQRHGLSPEAAEDPDILRRHIERIAAQVHRIVGRPAEHAPVTFPEDEGLGVADPDATEALWDELYKHNRRQQERMERAIEERRGQGVSDDEAFDHALGDLGLEVPGEETEPDEEPWDHGEPELFAGEDDAADDPLADVRPERHPLLRRATELWEHLNQLFRDTDRRFEPSLGTLFRGVGDTVGGLAQALSGREDEDDCADYGLRVTQLKRALRGAAFARGALFPLCEAVTAEQLAELRRTLKQLEQDVYQELSRRRAQRRAGDA